MAHAFAVPFGGRPAAAPRLRLTRRGRLVLVAFPAFVVSVLLLAGLAGFLSPARAGDSAPAVTSSIQVTVQQGQSLWSVAEQYAPDRDPRVVIGEIVELNGLDSARVLPGQQLLVPRQG